MKNDWREYLDTLENPLEFLHADELKAKYRIENVKLPVIFKKENDMLELLIDAAEINDCRDSDDLKQIINDKIWVSYPNCFDPSRFFPHLRSCLETIKSKDAR